MWFRRLGVIDAVSMETISSHVFVSLQGKVFPKLRKRSSAARLIEQDGSSEEQTAADYVFRLVYPGCRHDASKSSVHAAVHAGTELRCWMSCCFLPVMW